MYKIRIVVAYNHIKKQNVYLLQTKLSIFRKWKTLNEFNNLESAEKDYASLVFEQDARRKNKLEKRIVVKKSY